MIVKLGYVSLSKALEDITPSGTITYTNFEKESYPVEKLLNITENNLKALKEIILYNIKNNIHFYRLTSKLVPLATHDKVNFNYITPFKNYYQDIGKMVNDNKIRIDTHPDQYTVLNSTDERIVKNTIEILKYHYNVLKALNIKNPIIIIHIGSSVFGKEASIKRFIKNFNKLPKYIRKSIAVENDDKVYNIKDVLKISKKLSIPMVLDYHHYICNNDGEKIEDYIENIVNTWNDLPPKFHFSSPKSKQKKEFRSHHDYINSNDFINFLKILKPIDKNIDIMIEAKAKDDALFRLTRELKYKTNYIFLDETSFII